MKLTILFIALGVLNAHASAVSQTVSLSGKNIVIARIFNAIEQQTGYTVFANKGLLKEVKPVTVSARQMPLEDFLVLVLKDQPIEYEIRNKTIFIKERSRSASGAISDPLSAGIVKPVLLDISGTVRSAAGSPLAGATIIVKGTRASAVTNADGEFSIKAEPNQVLVVSYIGYQTLEEPVKGRSRIEITLAEASNEMTQVVVTALGIPRRVKSLTYNVQEVKGTDILSSDGGFVNSLNGKIAGATINSSSAGAGASSRVILRGAKSIYGGNNNALYVIDGIPMQNEITRQADDIFTGAGQTGDFINNINPDDIESISVLSGPSAAALYGAEAAAGVILITTKKGAKDKTNISLSNSTNFSKPMILPEFQNTYGVTETGSYSSWGEKLVTPSSYDPADFFQTGLNINSSLNISTGGERSQTYISLGNVISKGIIPNNNYHRHNFTVRNTAMLLNNKLSLDFNLMGSFVGEQNMISQGLYFNPLVATYLFPPGEDFNKAKAFERHDATRNLPVQFWPWGDAGLTMQNPYWVAERDKFKNRKERFIPSLSAKYTIADWINVAGRVKLDKNNEKAERRFSASTNTLFASQHGFYSLTSIDSRQIYADMMLNINKSLSDKITLTSIIGTAFEDLVSNTSIYAGKLAEIANFYTYGNIDKLTSEARQQAYHRQKKGVFANAQLNYENMIFLDLTARNDWHSNLAGTLRKSFAYPSAGLSAVLTDLFNIKSNKLSYLKVRGSYSEVGGEPEDFIGRPTYSLVSGFGQEKTRMPNPNLKPERTRSLELGINSSFFRGALKIDATVYTSRTYNQFFEPTFGSTSQYTSIFVNGGRVDNKGLELTARYTKRLGALEWSSYANYSLNRNKIVMLLRNWENPVDGSIISLSEINQPGTGSYRITLTEGGTMGDVYVNTLRVDEHGAIYVDPGSQTVVPETNKFIYAGTSIPKYNLSWGNDFKYKGFGLNALFTARVGGVVVSNTQAMLDAFGVSKASADARDNGGALVNGRPVPAKEYYQVVGAGASGGIGSMYTYSATNVRLAELSIGYDIPVRKFSKTIKSANISFVGRNLFFLYNTAPFDPELTASTSTYFQGIDYFMMPSLRSLGFSVKLNF